MRIPSASRALGAVTALALGMAAAPSVQAQPREIRIGVVSDVLTLDPHNYRDRITQTVVGNLFDPLFLRMDAGSTHPALLSAVTEVNPTTYEATVRPGVKFHDGTIMTAEDIKFSLDRIIVENAMGGTTSPRRSLLSPPLSAVEIVAPDRLRFRLSAPWPIMQSALSTGSIVSKRFAEAQGNAGMATRVNGTGPFKLLAWNRGDSVTMERFADYYGGPATLPPVGPARVDRVTFRVIPELASRVAALLAGEIDIATEMPVHLRPQIERSARAKVVTANGTRTFFVSLNVTRPPFSDVRVRKAANHAIDRKLIIERVLAGTATPLEGVLSPESYGYMPSLPAHAYDPALAKRLLAEAGHAGGLDLTLDTIAATKDLAEAMAAMLTEVGLRTKVQVWEGAVLTPLWQNPDKKERDMYLTSWGNAWLEPTGIMVPTLMTRGRGNSAGYANGEVDRLLNAAAAEVDDARRVKAYQDAQAIVNREAPWIFLWVPQDIYGVSTQVRDWQPQPSAMIYLHRATLGR